MLTELFFSSNFYIETINNLDTSFIYLKNWMQLMQISEQIKADKNELYLKRFFEFKNGKEFSVNSFITNEDDDYKLKGIVFEYMPNMIHEESKVIKDVAVIRDTNELLIKYYIPEISQNSSLGGFSKQWILGEGKFRHIITLFPKNSRTLISYETDSDLHRVVPVLLIAGLSNYWEYVLYTKQLMNVVPHDMLVPLLSDWNYRYPNLHEGWIHFEQFLKSGSWNCVGNFVELPDGTKKYVSEVVWCRKRGKFTYYTFKFGKSVEWEKMIFDSSYSPEHVKRYFVKNASSYKPMRFFK